MHNIIDLGSNTLRFGQYDIENENIIKQNEVIKHISISQYLDKDGVMSLEGVDILIKTIKEILYEFRIDSLYIIATASLRNCNNSKYVVNEVKKHTGLTINIMSGEKEAKLSFYGAHYDIEKLNIKSGFFLDIGGGSSEIVLFNGKTVVYKESFQIGCSKLYNMFCERNQKEANVIDEMYTHIFKIFDKLVVNVGVKYKYKSILSGGTGETFQKVYNHFFKDKSVFEVADLDKILVGYVDGSIDVTSFISTFDVKRADIFIPGILILRCIMLKFNIANFCVTEFGVREGFLKSKTGDFF